MEVPRLRFGGIVELVGALYVQEYMITLSLDPRTTGFRCELHFPPPQGP